MVVRVWRGRTRTTDANGYEEYLRGYQGYRETPGYVASFLLRRPAPQDGETEFELVSLWTSMEAVLGYAGPDPSRANLHGVDKAVLTFSDAAEHFTLSYSDGSLREANLLTRQVGAGRMTEFSPVV